MALTENKVGFHDPLGPDEFFSDEALDAMWTGDAKLFNDALRGPATAIQFSGATGPRPGNERPDYGDLYEDADLFAEIMK
jgi:hypothetical protein